MKIYTRHGYVLGVRCEVGHSGNRRILWVPSTGYGECLGCGHFFAPDQLPHFATRAEALAADRAFVARWPEDSPADILARRRI